MPVSPESAVIVQRMFGVDKVLVVRKLQYMLDMLACLQRWRGLCDSHVFEVYLKRADAQVGIANAECIATKIQLGRAIESCKSERRQYDGGTLCIVRIGELDLRSRPDPLLCFRVSLF